VFVRQKATLSKLKQNKTKTCVSRDATSRIAEIWKEIFENYIYDKGLTSGRNTEL
jgi:hypothetical protein